MIAVMLLKGCSPVRCLLPRIKPQRNDATQPHLQPRATAVSHMDKISQHHVTHSATRLHPPIKICFRTDSHTLRVFARPGPRNSEAPPILGDKTTASTLPTPIYTNHDTLRNPHRSHSRW